MGARREPNWISTITRIKDKEMTARGMTLAQDVWHQAVSGRDSATLAPRAAVAAV